MALSVSVLGSVACGNKEKPEEVKHEIWSTYSTRKVIQNAPDNSIYDRLPAKLSVQMMKSETEGAQLIITAAEDIKEYSLTATDLTDGNGNTIPKENIEVLHQKYVEIVRMHSTNKEIKAGNFVPDMLLPMDKAIEFKENNVLKGKNQGITIEITTAHETVPGIYTGNFVLDIDGEKTDIPVSCEVWDIEYEGRRSFMTSFLLYRYQLMFGEYDNSPETIKSYIDFFMKYKANIYVIKDSYPVDEFREEAIRQFEDNNCNSIIIPVNFDLSYKAEGEGQHKRVIDYLRELVKLTTEEKPYIDYAYFYPSNVDEADMETGAAGGSAAKMKAAYRFFVEDGEMQKTMENAVATFEAEGLFDGMTAEFASHVKQKILDLPFVFTNVGFVQDAVNKMNATFCPYLSLFDEQIQAEKYLEQAQERADGNLWTYTCTGPLYPYPSFHTDDYSLGARVTGWMEKKYNINGFLYWSCVRYSDGSHGNEHIDVYNTAARYAHCSGEGYLVYPGKYYGSSSPFASLRLISHRESMDDYDMLCVYEKLLNEYAEKYGIEGGLDVNDYVADIYDSLFSGAVYYTDDSLVFKAREELAKRILALKNQDKLVVSTDYDGKDANVTVYTTSPTLSINGEPVSGEVAGEGYKYTKTVSAASAAELNITAANGTYTHGITATAKVTDFASNNTANAVCSGRDGVESTQSTISVDGDKAKVMIRSYYAKGAGYGANVDVNGIDGPTSRLMPSITFNVSGFSGANAVHFNIKNTGSTVIELYVHLVMDNDLTEEIGTAYCGLGKSNDVRIQINKLLNVDTTKVKGIKLAFKNVYADANGYESLWPDREFELSDIWFEK
ncbi:MAG: DUF4091 domain-containing protein [Clostridia bacterium]|nr:DUF4091 domain-containing protein [Clostridia bacterium]